MRGGSPPARRGDATPAVLVVDGASPGFAPGSEDQHHAALATVDEFLDLELGIPQDLDDLGEAFDDAGAPKVDRASGQFVSS